MDIDECKIRFYEANLRLLVGCKSFSLIVEVPAGQNIIKEIFDEMKCECNDIDLYDSVLTSVKWSELYQHVDIESIVEVSPCSGCRNDSPGQRDHMEHRTGCLHDSSVCIECVEQ